MRKVLLGVVILVLLTACNPDDNYNGPIKNYWESNIKVSNITPAENNITIQKNITNVTVKLDIPYRIGSYNIQVFGPSKASNDDLMIVIEDIVNDYDILAIQEIRDSSGIVLQKLKEMNPIIYSERLGRSRSKEQYVFMTNPRVKVIDSALYPDIDDKFEREPFIGYFQVENYTFSIIQVHIKPTEAPQEIEALYDVVNWTMIHFDDRDWYIMGDLNMDCVYYDDNDGVHFDEYTQFITDDMDTTTGRSDCAYDRIISNEPVNVKEYGVDSLEEETGLDMELIGAISDHYPVYFVIGGHE